MLHLARKTQLAGQEWEELQFGQRKMQEMVTKSVLGHIRDILLPRKRPIHFGDLFDKIKERLGKEEFFRDHFKRFPLTKTRVKLNILSKDTNLGLISNGAELYVWYANKINLLETYEDFFTPMPGRSKAQIMRRVARDELKNARRVKTTYLATEIRRVADINFIINSFWILKGYFIITSERDGMYITLYHRLHFIGV